MPRTFAVAVLLAAIIPPAFAADTPQETADKARKILETNCYRCHGKNGSAEGGFDFVLDVKKLIGRASCRERV